jgi:alkanesulfonate monooxygenase SsuD/methylene tetrahydromethanopterin reductase-like flavin-dependent oxidoreductase (luciferase family)
VTWRLAARYADELNVDGLSPDEVREALPTIRSRCEEIDRDPDSLSVSVHIWWGTDEWRNGGEARRELLRDYADLGVSRVMGLLQSSADDDSALDALAEDARAAGVELD